MAPVVGRLLQKIDMRLIISFGVSLIAVTAFWRTTWTTDLGFWDFSIVQLVQGFGMPCFFIGIMTFAMTAVPPQEIPAAAGLLSFMRTVSGAAGTALATSAWDNATRESRVQMVSSLNGGDATVAGLEAKGMGIEQGRAVIERLVDAQSATVGAAHVYGVAGTFLLLVAAVIWLHPRPVLRTSGGPPSH